jgi:hypothetical protein
MRTRSFTGAAVLLALLAFGPRAAGDEAVRSAETSFGADGAALALFMAPKGSRFSLGARLGLGFEWTDFRMNDPAAALAVRWKFLESRHWAWWLGAEAGAAYLDTGYDRFTLPFAALSTGAGFRFRKRFSSFIEVGGRYGARDREHETSLAFLDARYEETIFIDPLVLRLGLALSF